MKPNRIEMEKKKVDEVLSQPEPKNIKDIRKILGLVNYYKRFIKDFAWVTKPINMLTRKNVKWQQEKEQQQTFDELKRIFTTRLVLVAPDLNKEFRIEANTSNYTTRGMLSVKCLVLQSCNTITVTSTLDAIKNNYIVVTNFIWTITLEILDQFQQSKWSPKALKKTFQMVPKMSQSNQYSPSYQQISQ